MIEVRCKRRGGQGRERPAAKPIAMASAASRTQGAAARIGVRPICSLLVIPTLARIMMPARVDADQAGRRETARTAETV